MEDFESEATHLKQSRFNRQYQSYSPLQNIEIGSDDSSLAVKVLDDENTKGIFTQWGKAIKTREGKYILSASGIVLSVVLMAISLVASDYFYRAAWSSNALPFSYLDPHDAGFAYIDRPPESRPGEIFRNMRNTGQPLPTNSWCENLFLGGVHQTDQTNKVYQIPYVVDTAGPVPGVRTHPVHVQSSALSVEATYEPENGVTLGSEHDFDPQHRVSGDAENVPARLAVVLEWESHQYLTQLTGTKMSTAIVRGSPYTSMEYFDAKPLLVSERSLALKPLVDETLVGRASEMTCGENGAFGPPASVQEEIKLTFDTSDMTWLVFISEPGLYVCSTEEAPPVIAAAPGVVGPPTKPKALFTLKAVDPMTHGMMRVAVANNCTTGRNPQYCDADMQPRDQSAFLGLLRNHADVYPTGKANIEFTFPVESEEEEELRLNFKWNPQYMSSLRGEQPVVLSNPDGTGSPRIELLMYATPHHQDRMEAAIGSSNVISDSGCVPTIHGTACPVTGDFWCMVEHLHRTGFHAQHPIREEMVPDLQEALKSDIHFTIDDNYMNGAGDTYFSGKMLGKLARILLIAEEIGLDADGATGGVTKKDFNDALDRLRAGTTIWLNGKAASPLLYDASWGGIVMCGCDYNDQTGKCNNQFPDCPALTDAGSNFGAGFYNDHHFHFGYHILAAAVVARFDHAWGRKYFQRALMLVRDIANPSVMDPFFPTWRHKDWYLGFSWASGIVTIQGEPYPNGRNQESSSEAISAYESVALFGESFASIFRKSAMPADKALLDVATRIKDMGRLLLATEIRSAKTYWHVQQPNTSGVARVYPDNYSPKVVGMIWSMLAQQQTWFGNEAWKSYGIQLMPLTPVAQQRDSPSWIREMLPLFKESCYSDPECVTQGWSIVILSSMAVIGEWKNARDEALKLSPDVFFSAGGNGHSLSNTLWYIATRPVPSAEDYALGNRYPVQLNSFAAPI